MTAIVFTARSSLNGSGWSALGGTLRMWALAAVPGISRLIARPSSKLIWRPRERFSVARIFSRPETSTPSMWTTTMLERSGAGGTATCSPSGTVTVFSSLSGPQRGALRSSSSQRPYGPAPGRKLHSISTIAAGDSNAASRLSNVTVFSRMITSGPSAERTMSALRSSRSAV